MRILYDSQIFTMQPFGAISRYFNKLALYNEGMFESFVSGKFSNNIYVQALSKMKPFPIKSYFKGKGRIQNYINCLADKKTIRKEEFDLYHPTYYFVPEYPKNKPTVITAHDFIHEIFPEFFSVKDKTSEAKKKSFNHASRIIAISNKTKEDLLKYFPFVDESHIDVVYHAIEWEPRVKQQLSFDFDKPYILFTGQRGGYKNFLPFCKAVAPILKENDLYLVCTGQPFNTEEQETLQSLQILERIKNLFATEEELRELYENALCFVFPSMYEGFGFPILEAFVSKTPCLLANASCFPEIAGNGALYFDPNSIDDMKNAIQRVVQSEALRSDLIKKGSERFEAFSMKNMIEGTVMTYNNAINMY